MRKLAWLALVATIIALACLPALRDRPAAYECTPSAMALACMDAYPKCGPTTAFCSTSTPNGCGGGKSYDVSCDCPSGQTCINSKCVMNVPEDMASGNPLTTCMAPPGAPACPTGYTFQSSTSASGCFPNGQPPPNAFNPSFDNPPGPCSSVNDVVIACNNSPNCSFCLNPSAAIPPGCQKI